MRPERICTTLDSKGKIPAQSKKDVNRGLSRLSKAGVYKLDIVLEPVPEDAEKARTLRQNRYYWGVVIKTILNGLEDEGVQCDVKTLHEGLIYYASPYVEIEDPVSGGLILTRQRTKHMSKPEFVKYVDKIIAWAATEHNIIIPSPNGYI